MLKLYLLRHAQADNHYGVEDYQRPLTLHGIRQSGVVAASLSDIKIAVCSSALRTKMTLDAIKKAGSNIQKTVYSDQIYNGTTGDLFAAIQGCESEESVLIVAHNPGLHQLVNLLSIEDERNKAAEALRYDYVPATLSVFECPIENWKDIKPAQNNLVDLVIPD